MVTMSMRDNVLDDVAPPKQASQSSARPRWAGIDDDVAVRALHDDGVEKVTRRQRTDVYAIGHFPEFGHAPKYLIGYLARWVRD